jgi:hypothetical protein
MTNYPDAATYRPPSANRCCHPPPSPKKKKKIDPAIGSGRDPPQRLGGERSGQPQWPFLSSANPKKKKKKIRPLGVAVIHPQRPGGGLNPPQRPEGERFGHPQWVFFFFSLANQKKKKKIQPTYKLFLMPQN